MGTRVESARYLGGKSIHMRLYYYFEHCPEYNWRMSGTADQFTVTVYHHKRADDKHDPIAEFKIQRTVNGKVAIRWTPKSEIPMDFMDCVKDIKDLLM